MRPTHSTRLSRRQLLGLSATLLACAPLATGCGGVFESRFPRFASKDFWDAQWMSRNLLEGRKWEHDAFAVILDAEDRDVAYAREPIARGTAIASAVVAALVALERAGARLEVRVAPSRRVTIGVATPPAATAAVPDVARVERALATLPLYENMLVDEKLGFVEDRAYGACSDLEELAQSRKAPFTLPKGVTLERYEDMLYVLQARLASDYRGLRGFLVSMDALRMAVRSLDHRHGGSTANALAVLDALERDRRDADEVRRAITKWPLPGNADRGPLVARGRAIQQELSTSPAYLEWRRESGDVRNARRFGTAVVHAGAMLSHAVGRGTGADVFAEVHDAADSFDAMKALDTLLRVAPVDSRVKKLLREGRELTRAYAERGADGVALHARAKLVLMAPDEASKLVPLVEGALGAL